jgi:glutathione S-transferase
MKPLLWHIPISHFNEKARWALAYKGIEHDRRAPVPGAHMLYALWLTRGAQKTLPILQLDGETIGDSTAIIAALEERYPEPSLYPDDPTGRDRALALEDWFDEELGPHIRRVVFHEVLAEPRERIAEVTDAYLPRRLRKIAPARAGMARAASLFASLRYRAGSEAEAEEGRERVVAALDRLEAELGEGDYLVGGTFTVADLTAAALFYPLVLPAEGPRVPTPPTGLEEFRTPLKERPGYRWVQEMFRRHRHPPARGAASSAGGSRS